MAARLNPKHDARTRDKIRTSQLINRLEAFALCEDDPQTKKPVKMDSHQVTAALGLLKKTLPDLSVTDLKHGISESMAQLLGEIDGQTKGLPGRRINGYANGAGGTEETPG